MKQRAHFTVYVHESGAASIWDDFPDSGDDTADIVLAASLVLPIEEEAKAAKDRRRLRSLRSKHGWALRKARLASKP